VSHYKIGALVRCRGRWLYQGYPRDPVALSFRFRTRAGATTTYVYGSDPEIVKQSTGYYYVDVSATTAGEWAYSFSSTGWTQAADEKTFTVDESEF
jgi:hypothetical protein